MSKVARGLQAQKDDLDRVDDQAVKIFRVSGRVQVIGDGESSVQVTFPVVFADRPGFSFGFEMATYQQLVAGHFPTVSAGVYQWSRYNSGVTGLYRYVGATLIVVTTGNPNYLFVHWHVEGPAFQNPVNLVNPDAIDGS